MDVHQEKHNTGLFLLLANGKRKTQIDGHLKIPLDILLKCLVKKGRRGDGLQTHIEHDFLPDLK